MPCDNCDKVIREEDCHTLLWGRENKIPMEDLQEGDA